MLGHQEAHNGKKRLLASIVEYNTGNDTSGASCTVQRQYINGIY